MSVGRSVGRSDVLQYLVVMLQYMNLQDCIKKLISGAGSSHTGVHVGMWGRDRWGREGSTDDA